MMSTPKRILLCRTDSIGDVMVTLPLVGWIKHHWPDAKVDFAGGAYTRAVIQACPLVDEFVNADDLLAMNQGQAASYLTARHYDAALFAFPEPQWMELVAMAKIPMRIATASRLASWRWANERVWFSRKNSPLHEAQLNAFLLGPLGIKVIPQVAQLIDVIQFVPNTSLPKRFHMPDRPLVLLHPKSKGSAVEWGVPSFMELAQRLTLLGYAVMITGTAAEGDAIKAEVEAWPDGVIDSTGQLTLDELIALISKAQALVAASTGPLHIAAALGIRTIGLYTPQRPMHPGRWAPLGKNTCVLVAKQHPIGGERLAISVDDVVRAVVGP